MKRYILLVLTIIAVLLLTGCGAAEDLPVPPVEMPAIQAVGAIDITDAEAMIVQSTFSEIQTAEISLETAEELAEFFNGRALIGERSACASDLLVKTDTWKLYVHTDCGTVNVSAEGIEGSTQLGEDEVAELCEILGEYDLRIEFTGG